MEKTRQYRRYLEPQIRTINLTTFDYYIKSLFQIKNTDPLTLKIEKEIRDKYYKDQLSLFIDVFNRILDSELEFDLNDYNSYVQYIKEHFYLSKEYTAFAGNVDIRLNTWLTPSLFYDIIGPYPETLVVKKSSQLGFTTIMLIMSIISVLKRKQSLMYVLPTKDMVKVFWKTKVTPLIKNSDKLKRYIVSVDYASKVIETSRGNVIFTYASSPTALASHSCPIVIMDEVAKYVGIKESNAIELAKERAKTYRNKKFILFSTPTVKDTIFEKNFELYPVKKYCVACPICGEKQFVEFSDFKQYEDGSVYFETKCGHFITDNATTLCELGDYAFETENVDYQNGVSYVIPTYLSSFVDFKTLYRKYYEASYTASKELVQSFENNYLARTFDHSILRMRVNLKQLEDKEIVNELSKDNVKMFTGVDVGENFIYVLSFIADIYDKTCPIIVVDYQKIDLGEFTQIVDKIIEYKPYGYTPDRVGIDYGYKTNELRVLFSNYANVIPIRGRTTDTIRNQKILYNSNTKMIEIFSHFFKTKIAQLMNNERLFFYKATDKLVKHLGSHECYLDPRDGTILWKSKFSEGYEDHYLDALIYAYVAYYVSVEM